MKNPLRILHLEDNQTDAELVKEILSLEDLNFTIAKVDNREDFVNIINEESFDLILADYSLPSFDGLSALKETRERGLSVPFILVSAVLGEELAIEAMHSGATDYVLKSRLERLVPAILRAIREVEDRDQRIKLESEISELIVMYEKIAERVRGFLKMNLPSGKYSMVDKYLEELSGYSTREWYATPNFIETLIHSDYQKIYQDSFDKMKEGIIPRMIEYKIIKKDGEERWWLQFAIGAYDINQKLISVSIVIIDNTDSKESFLKYQNLFENALVGMFRSDVEFGKILEANENMAMNFGFSSIEEYKQLNAKDFYYTDEARKKVIDLMNKQGYIHDHQLQLKRKDGSPIWISMSAKIYVKGGYIEGVMVDISSQKKAEAALKRDRRAFQIIAEAAVEAIDIPEMCSQILNGLIETLGFEFGTVRFYKKEERILELVASVGFDENARNHSASISIDDYSYITADVARHKRPLFAPDLTKSEYMKLKTTPFKIDNIQAFISWPILSSKQELIGTLQLDASEAKNFSTEDRTFFETIVGMFASSLERKLSDEALLKSERAKQILANIVESSKEVVIQGDENGTIFYASSPVKDVFGYTPKELIGESFSKLAPPGGEEKQKKMFKTIMESGSVTFESIRQHKDGTLIPVIVTMTPEKDETTGKVIVNAVIVDISEVKRLEASLRDRSYELEVLNKIISAGYLARSLNELLDFTLSAILNSLDFNGGAIYFIDEEDGTTASLRRSLGMSIKYVKMAAKLRITSPTIKKLFVDGKPILVSDYMKKSEDHMDFGIATLIAVPFFSKQKVIGGLFLSTKEKRTISKDDLTTLEAIGREIGTSFAKMLVEEEYQDSEKNLLSVLTSIGDLVLIIDAETGKILRVNKKAQQKLAYRTKALRKMTIQELIPDNKLLAFNDVIAKTLKSGKEKYQLTLKTKTQKKIDFEMHFYKTIFSNKEAILLLDLKS